TYQLLGDELDGPRGRIYQIKQVLEGHPANPTVREHLDRCLTCRACETTCPSGVNYHRLLDIGRAHVERQTKRPLLQRLQRRAMIELLAYRSRFTPMLRLGQLVRPLMPRKLRANVPKRVALPAHPAAAPTTRKVIVLDGCVQPGLAPEINHALERVLQPLGVAVARATGAGCCGALPHHLNDSERAREMARRNIDAWLPLVDAGAEAIIVTASGCGAHVADYPHLLADDADYAAKARRIAELAQDPLQFVAAQPLERLTHKARTARIAVHTPCTLQHALKLNGAAEAVLTRLGYTLCDVGEGHLCCGSAGTYSILQPELSQQLRRRKLAALNVDRPDLVVTANIGCLMHLGDPDGVPVRHWLNLVADDLQA
ncbi:MAG: glycolate oxidase subunit GlcF, partial [Gammaproteobacteria bacterium]|nr:glycolate oxidase subunit GlcF [Gammaproteobacteria bacterium]